MSDGLKYLRALIDDGDRSSLFNTTVDDFIEGEVANEVAVYNYIVQHSSEYQCMPSIDTVRTETGIRLPEASDSSEYYLHKIIDRRIFNEAREINRDFREDMSSRDVSNLYEIGRRYMNVANDTRITGKGLVSASGFTDLVDSAEETSKEGKPTIPLGLPNVDDAMMGGLLSSDLAFIVARSNVGKTNLLLNAARTAYEAGHKILIVSMETSMEDMSLHFLSHMAGVNPKYLTPYALGTYTRRRIDAITADIEETDRVHIHKGGSCVTPNKVRWLIESLNPDAVYVDSMYLMKPDGTNTDRLDRYSKIAMVTDQMLEIVVELGTPILCTSQLNRQAGKGGKDASLETLGFSDSITTHASLIITVKSIYSGEDDTDRQIDIRDIEVMKSRKGTIDPYAINYTFSPMDFSQVDPAQAAPEESDEERATNQVVEVLDMYED